VVRHLRRRARRPSRTTISKPSCAQCSTSVATCCFAARVKRSSTAFKQRCGERSTSLQSRSPVPGPYAPERDRGTEKGLSYEALVAETSAWVCSQDDVEFTGGIRGEEGNKNGDVLVRLNRTATRDHDLRIGLEAKDERKAEPAILAELDAAIRNRAAEAGIFVFAKRQQAPLDGRALRVYSGNRFAILFDKMTKTTKIRSRSKPSAEWPAEFSSPSSTNKHHQSILSSSPTGSSASTTSSTTPPRSPVFSNPRVGASTRSKAAMNSSLWRRPRHHLRTRARTTP